MQYRGLLEQVRRLHRERSERLQPASRSPQPALDITGAKPNLGQLHRQETSAPGNR